MKRKHVVLLGCILAFMMFFAAVDVFAADNEAAVSFKGNKRVIINLKNPKIGNPVKDSSIGTVTLTKDYKGDALPSNVTVTDKWYSYDEYYNVETECSEEAVFQENTTYRYKITVVMGMTDLRGADIVTNVKWDDDIAATVKGNAEETYVGEILLIQGDIKKADVSLKDMTYTGKAVKPKPSVSYDGEKLTEGTDYTLAYSSNKAVGTAKVTIKGVTAFTGTRNATFRILPKGTKITKIKGAKKSFTAKWKAVKTKMYKARITGYQIQYSKDKTFKKGAKAVKVKGYKTTKKTVKKLSKKKKYYARIRTYMKVKGKNYYSKWSKTVKVKTK